MPRYASQTEVPVDRSRGEIEKTLKRYGADAFGYGEEDGRAIVMFRMCGKKVRFIITVPDQNDAKFTETPTGLERSARQALSMHGQAVRQQWRRLLLLIKAKLEAADGDVVMFEQEFMPYFVLPDGMTLSDKLLPAINKVYADGKVPLALISGIG